MKGYPNQHQNGFSSSRRRRLASAPTTTAIAKTASTDDAEYERKRRMRLTRNFRLGYSSKASKFRKQFRRAMVGILGVTITVVTFSCFSHALKWNLKFSYFEYPFIALTFAGSPIVNQSTNDLGWGGSNDDGNEFQYVPPDGESWPSRRQEIFTSLTIQDKRKLKRMKKDFEKFQSTGMLMPCRLDDNGCFQEMTPSIAEYFTKFLRSSLTTRRGGHRILLHNPLQEDRFWCGKRILGGGGTLEVADFPDQCRGEKVHESLPYVHSNRPPAIPKKDVATDDDGLEAVELFFNVDDFESLNDRVNSASLPTKIFPCSVKCKTNGNYMVLNTINVRNTNWTILHTMEGEQIYPEARVRPSAYRDSQFYATTSFQSEIPLPYFSWNEYNIQHAGVNFRKVIKGASFLANNCESKSKREEVVKELIETPLRVDSLSGCLNNTEALPGVDMENKTAVMGQYLFHLAFENQKADDYITEKLWGALAAGTLPVYLGAKNVKEHVPINSIIVADDFDSSQDLANYLIRLTNDEDLYESYHQWRYQNIDDTFASKYEFTNTHSTCRICMWAFAKRHGLGWNHSRQTITRPHIDHKTCRNEMGLIGYPFKEYWLSSTKTSNTSEESEMHIFSKDANKSCTLNEENRIIEAGHGAIRRKVYDRDGVTDLIVDITTGNNYNHFILRLVTPIKALEANQKPHVVNQSVWWLQDHESRFYVIAGSSREDDIQLSIHKPGTIQILIPSPPRSSVAATTIRIRIVTENVDHFHKKTKKTPSYFGDLMIRDFFEPLRSYRIMN